MLGPGLLASHDAVQRVVEAITSRPGLLARGVVLTQRDSGPDHTGLDLHVDAARNLRIEQWGVSLCAEYLTCDQAADFARLLQTADDVTLRPPPPATGDAPWTQYASADGAVRAEFTIERVPTGGATSPLPLPDDEYLSAAATTATDLAALAPTVDEPTRDAIHEIDPTLDDDLAHWLDETSTVARLSVLGPVRVRAGGALERRVGYYTELAAYLATRRHGATAEEIAAWFSGGNVARVRKDLNVLRTWLGTDPRTDALHVPDARQTRSMRERGIAAYEVNVLVDADLFRRLRLRGQARGEEGHADRVAALGLVTGEPFTQIRPDGGQWLIEGDRLDYQLAAAVIDLAHLVTVHALAMGDVDTARWAVEQALLAGPHEEIPHTDLVAVRDASTGRAAAQHQLRTGMMIGANPYAVHTALHPLERRLTWTNEHLQAVPRASNDSHR